MVVRRLGLAYAQQLILDAHAVQKVVTGWGLILFR